METSNYHLELHIELVRHMNIIASHVLLPFWNKQSIKCSAPGIERRIFYRSEAADQSDSIFIHE